MKIRIYPRARRALAVGLLPAALFAIATESNAGQLPKTKSDYANEIGASERVNYSGKLRMLSQRVVATSCNFAAGIDPDKSGPAMRDAMDEFNMIVDALEFGNADLGINGEEKRRKTIARIEMLRGEWAPVASGLGAIAEGETSQERITAVANQSADLLEMAKLLVSDLSAQYSDPNAMLQSFAMLVDISGRQRMLTQRMSKNICLASSGVNVETARSELAATAQMFETSLFALSQGMLTAGINPPPNQTIADGLDVVISNWTELKPSVEAITGGMELSDEERARVYHGMNQMTGNMNTVVGLYSDASKFDY